MISARPLPRKPQPDEPHPRLSPIERTTAMTICIAAICNGNVRHLWYPDGDPQFIVGISDRMISTKRTQSELPQPKFRKTVNSVMVQMSGVVDVTAKIFDRTNYYISKEFSHDPQTIPVERIADIYSQYLIKFLENRRDTICQARTGLRYQDFLKKHHDWPQALHEDIIDEINDEPGTQTIITGIDESGAHIYLIDSRGSISCKDSIGFAVIGSGSLHAHSQIMQSRHSPNASYYDTLFLIYMAKKQAELDRDVGKDTDIFVIKDDTNYDILHHKTVKILGDVYDQVYKKLFADAKERISNYLKENK